MALVPSSFQAGLAPLNAPQPSGAITAQTIMTAFNTYALAAQNVMGLPTLAMPGFSGGMSSLQAAMSAPVPSGAIAATNIATAINTAWMSLQTQFQTGPLVANMASLQQQLSASMTAPVPSGQIFIMNLVSAVHTYCMTSTITGVIPGTPPVPFTGPPL